MKFKQFACIVAIFCLFCVTSALAADTVYINLNPTVDDNIAGKSNPEKTDLANNKINNVFLYVSGGQDQNGETIEFRADYTGNVPNMPANSFIFILQNGTNRFERLHPAFHTKFQNKASDKIVYCVFDVLDDYFACVNSTYADMPLQPGQIGNNSNHIPHSLYVPKDRIIFEHTGAADGNYLSKRSYAQQGNGNAQMQVTLTGKATNLLKAADPKSFSLTSSEEIGVYIGAFFTSAIFKDQDYFFDDNRHEIVKVAYDYWADLSSQIERHTKCLPGCDGVCKSGKVFDDCQVCDGNNASKDCAGICGGTTVKDCADVCGGTAVKDCNDVCGGTSVPDCAGICGGNTPHDCAGICGGTTTEDCAGVCGGTAVVDSCGICGGNDHKDICNRCPNHPNYDDSITDPKLCDCPSGFNECGTCGPVVKDCEGICQGKPGYDPKKTCDNPCQEENKSDLILELDSSLKGLLNRLDATHRRTSYRINGHSKKSVSKKLIAKVKDNMRLRRKSGSDAYVSGWETIWTKISTVQLICPENTTCTKVSNAEALGTYVTNSETLEELVKAALKDLRAVGGSKRGVDDYRQALTAEMKKIASLVVQVPTNNYDCHGQKAAPVEIALPK